MRTPFDTEPSRGSLQEATAAQLNLISIYTQERAALFRLLGDEAQASRVLETKFDVKTRREASDLISRMALAIGEQKNGSGFTADDIRCEIQRQESASEPVEPGLYSVNEDIYKVARSKSSGRLYAQLLDQETGSFDYAPGAMKRIDSRDRMSLEDAKAYGRKTGMCCVCSRILTNPVSVAEGIGPICSGRV